MSHEIYNQIPPKYERLNAIFLILKESAPATSVEEAVEMTANAFKTIEEHVVPLESERMSVMALSKSSFSTFKGRKFYFQNYRDHMIFFGENGAIDIRLLGDMPKLTKPILDAKPDFAMENMKCVFEKRGADGNGVWN